MIYATIFENVVFDHFISISHDGRWVAVYRASGFVRLMCVLIRPDLLEQIFLPVEIMWIPAGLSCTIFYKKFILSQQRKLF